LFTLGGEGVAYPLDGRKKAIFKVSKYSVNYTDVIVGDKVTLMNVEIVVDLSDPEDRDLIYIDDESDQIANDAIDVMAYCLFDIH
jgi:hypothetical protein